MLKGISLTSAQLIFLHRQELSQFETLLQAKGLFALQPPINLIPLNLLPVLNWHNNWHNGV